MRGVADEAVRQFRDVYQSVLFNADVDKAAEVGDVGHDARQDLPRPYILDVFDVGVEGEYLDGLSRVASRFVSFLQDVPQGREPHLLGDITLDIQSFLQFLVGDQLRHGAA